MRKLLLFCTVLASLYANAQTPDTIQTLELKAVEIESKRTHFIETERAYIAMFPKHLQYKQASNALDALQDLMGIKLVKDMDTGGMGPPYPAQAWGPYKIYINGRFIVAKILLNGSEVNQYTLLEVPIEKILCVRLIKRGKERDYRGFDTFSEIFERVICIYTKLE